MIITMDPNCSADHAHTLAVARRAEKYGLKTRIDTIPGAELKITQVYLLTGANRTAVVPDHVFDQMSGVQSVQRVTPSELSLAMNGHHHPLLIGGTEIGSGQPCRLIAGPCTVDREIGHVVRHLVENGITDIRGGCWKPRSAPASFRGHKDEGVKLLLGAAAEHGAKAVYLEVGDCTHVEVVDHMREQTGFQGDIVLWIGARTYNPWLLDELSRRPEYPVMIKNPLGGGVDEWLKRGEFVVGGEPAYDLDAELLPEPVTGNSRVMFCSRGVQVQNPKPFRFYPEHEAIAAMKVRTWAPVGVDPCHSAGRVDLVPLVLQSSLALGALYGPDFVLFEVESPQALCDADQAWPIKRLDEIKQIVAQYNALRC